MSPAVQIQAVDSRSGLMEFIRMPWSVNAGDKNWVPPLIQDRQKLLDAKRNPFFQRNQAAFLLARINGRPMGRIAVMQNELHQRRYADKTGFFGFFDAVDHAGVFAALISAAKEWLRRAGCERMLGPVCPDTNNELGVLVEGFDSPPYFMLPHNPRYYDARLRELGLTKAMDFHSYLLASRSFAPEPKLARVNGRVRRRYPIHLRPVRLRQLAAELELIREIYNDAFARHWGFVPMTSEDVRYFAQDLRQVIDPELVLIGEFKGQPVGFLLAVPNVNEVLIRIPDGRILPFGWLTFLANRRRIRGVRVMTIGIRQKCQAFGLGGLFYEEIARRIIAGGYEFAEMSWIAEDNQLMNSAARMLGGRIYKTYRLYEKAL